MSKLLLPTIGNQEWMQANQDKIKKVFPATWTHTENLDLNVKIGFQLKVLGIDWRSTEELAKVITVLTMAGIVQMKVLSSDAAQIRRAP